MSEPFVIVEKRTGEEGFEDFFVKMFDTIEQAQVWFVEMSLDPKIYKIKKW